MASGLTPEQQRTMDGIPGLDGYEMWGDVAVAKYRVGKVSLRAEVLPSGRIGKAWTFKADIKASGLSVITCVSERETRAENPR